MICVQSRGIFIWVTVLEKVLDPFPALLFFITWLQTHALLLFCAAGLIIPGNVYLSQWEPLPVFTAFISFPKGLLPLVQLISLSLSPALFLSLPSNMITIEHDGHNRTHARTHMSQHAAPSLPLWSCWAHIQTCSVMTCGVLTSGDVYSTGQSCSNARNFVINVIKSIINGRIMFSVCFALQPRHSFYMKSGTGALQPAPLLFIFFIVNR